MDCDSVEMQKGGISYEIDQQYLVFLVDAMRLKLYFSIAEIYYSNMCLNFHRPPCTPYSLCEVKLTP